MAGLLDTLGSDDVLGGLLSAGAASGAKGNFLSRMAQGLQAGDKFSQGRRDEARLRSQDEMRAEYQKLMQMKMQRDMQQQEAAAKQEGTNNEALRRSLMPTSGIDALSGGGGPTLANAEKIGQQQPFDVRQFIAKNPGVDLQGIQQYMALGSAMNPKREILTGKPGDVFFDKNDPTKPLGSVPERATPIDYNKPFLPDGTPNRAFQDYSLTRADRGATRVNVEGSKNIMSQESEQSKAYGKSFGDLRAKINTDAFNAPQKEAKLNRMEQLLAGVDGGKFAPAGKELASMAQSAFGIKLDPKLGNKEAAQALAVEMALSMRQPGSGATSDRDFDNWLATVPDLSKSAAGRAEITSTMRASLKRDKEVAKLARAYAKAHDGVIDDGFMEQLSSFVADNPVVKRSPTPDANVDALVNKYRSK